MSKGLEALERIGKCDLHSEREDYCYLKNVYVNEYNIIEKELIEKEQQDNVLKILKEIIEFKRMLPHIEPNKDNGFDIMSAVGINIQRDIENKERELLRQWVLKTCFPKELKALEIIKPYIQVYAPNKSVDRDEYMLCVGHDAYEIPKEIYDLLKEVLL